MWTFNYLVGYCKTKKSQGKNLASHFPRLHFTPDTSLPSLLSLQVTQPLWWGGRWSRRFRSGCSCFSLLLLLSHAFVPLLLPNYSFPPQQCGSSTAAVPPGEHLLQHGLIHRLQSLQGVPTLPYSTSYCSGPVVPSLPPPWHFLSFIKYVFTEVPPAWLMGSAVSVTVCLELSNLQDKVVCKLSTKKYNKQTSCNHFHNKGSILCPKR